MKEIFSFKWLCVYATSADLGCAIGSMAKGDDVWAIYFLVLMAITGYISIKEWT